MTTRQIRIDVLRHAQPLNDPETKRSLDCLTLEGMSAAIEKGRSYRDWDGDIIFYHSPKAKARQTIDGIQIGLEREVKYEGAHNDGLGLDFYEQAPVKLQSAYGPAALQAFVDANPEVPKRVKREITYFLSEASWLCHDGSKVAHQLHNPLVIAVSHAPKVEIAAGMLRGLPLDGFGDLAALPLEGFQIYINQTPDGRIDQIELRYKQGDLENITNTFFGRERKDF